MRVRVATGKTLQRRRIRLSPPDAAYCRTERLRISASDRPDEPYGDGKRACLESAERPARLLEGNRALPQSRREHGPAVGKAREHAGASSRPCPAGLGVRLP